MSTTLFKPAGLPVFPPHRDPTGPCLLQQLVDQAPWRREVPFPEGFAGGIAHRLDTDTSGAVLVADDLVELAHIRQAFADRAFVKIYHLIARRAPTWELNEASVPLGHDPHRRSRMVAQRGRCTPHRGDWLEARTTFRQLQGRLLEARMSTGVMHQIRAHAAFLGVALAGDRLYAGGPPVPGETSFCLHHLGLTGPFTTRPVPAPAWLSQARSTQTGA